MSDVAHLLVSAHQGLFLARAERCPGGNVEILRCLVEGYTFGVTWGLRGVYVARQDPGWSRDRTDREAIVLLNGPGDYSILPDYQHGCLMDAHQLAWREGKIWVMSSRSNEIVLLDETGGLLEAFSPDPGWKNRPPHMATLGMFWSGLYRHWNSITFGSGRVWLLAHNYGLARHRQGGWPWLVPSEVWKVNEETRDVGHRFPAGLCCHNLAWWNNRLWWCNSYAGTVENACERKLSTPRFTRGLAIEENGMTYVGWSHFLPRPERPKAPGGVYVTDLKTERVAGGGRDLGVGPVHDVRLLDCLDAAHPGPEFPLDWRSWLC